MAELELKGNVVAEPKVVGVTTNISGLDADKYSNQPSSIMRRMKVHIHARVRPDFKKEGSEELDPAKVHAKFGKDCLAPDIWLFDVFRVVVEAIDRPPKLGAMDSTRHVDDQWYLKHIIWNGSEMRNSSIYELIEYMRQASEMHFDEQRDLVTRSQRYSEDNICHICKHYCGLCSHTAPESADSTIYNIQHVLDNVGVSSSLGALPNEVNPHSSQGDDSEDIGSILYPHLVSQRGNKVEQDLKDMLYAWIVEGKCNFESVYSKFISGCNKEIQHLLIVVRKMSEKWFISNRKFLMEACFPKELEDTRIGDYFTLVVRKKETLLITRTSIVLEAFIRCGIFGVSYLYLQKEMAILLSWAGHLAISNVDIPSIVARKYVQGIRYVNLSKAMVSKAMREDKFDYIFLLSLVFYYYGPQSQWSLYIVCAVLCFATFLKSAKNISLYSGPRAISRIYKKEKEEYQGELLKIAPAVVAATTMYLGTNDIFDFCEGVKDIWKTKPQSRLKPSAVEVAERDKKHKFDDNWFKNEVEPYLDPLPTSNLRTPGEIRKAVGENVWLVRDMKTDAKTNCFVVCSGCILVPFHYIPKTSTTLTFTRHNRGNKGNRSFDAIVEPSQFVRVAKLDLAMLWMPKTRDVRNLIDCFPLEYHETGEFRTGRIATRDFDGNLDWTDVRELYYTRAATSGLGFTFPGIHYIWNGAKEGKCLSPVISDDKRACISGLHVGGSTDCREDGGYVAFGVTPTQGDLLEAKKQLEKFSTVIPMSSSGEFETTCMGVDTLLRTIKKKSCYLRMEGLNSAHFLGSSFNCNRTPKTQVRDTFIKSSVKKLFDINEDWEGPKFKGPDGHSPHQPWEVGMEKWIVDKPGLPFNLLNKAKTDYLNVVARVLYGEKSFWEQEIRVLTWDETINGIPGKRFIDSMNFKSSIGFPFKGSKKLFSENLGKVDDWQDKRVLEPQFIEEAEKIELLYKEGKRYYPWFTSTLKDEPTLSTKDKVRVFQATSTPFQLVMRKYTLGICRFLQMNPLDSECAVGIDPCSSEWNEMYTHLRKVQTPLYDRWFAIDYKAYDTSISSQMILAIGRIFTDIARIINYGDEDIRVLQSIFTELSFSVVDFNGDVLMLDGANPSGNSLTVFINNICNSLLMRIYFYQLYPNRTFSGNVRMMCYGDDLIAAVSATASSFTMKGYASYLEQFGFKVTPAQKDEKLKNFSTLAEIDFLKRKFVYSKEYGSMIAPLEELSIYKRLCNYMTSETDVEVIVGANIDGALDEWAFYGEKTYLEKQAKLIEIVDEFELHRFVYRLNLTFEQRVSLWKQRADPAVMGKGQSMDTESSNCDNDDSGFFGWGRLFPQWK